MKKTSTVGMGLWAGMLAYLGRIHGQNYGLVEQYMGPVSLVVIGLLVVGAMVLVLRRRSKQSIAGETPAQGGREQRMYQQSNE